MMKIFYVLFFLVSLAIAKPQHDREPLLGVKAGGVKGGQHSASQNISNFYGGNKNTNFRNLTGLSSTFNNQTSNFKNGSTVRDYEKGVCYEEVLTVTLAKDPHNVPIGNGSTPAHSKVRKCCPGYERNIHNFRICEPVCEHECINAKCILPNVCACFPDHVIGLDGNCIVTCPIGCLNGHCGPDKECICNTGYTEEPNMKFCIPKCSKGCPFGKCTGPEICTCEPGYHNDASGQCVPKCDNECNNGKCVAPNQCICDVGYEKDKLGKCAPVCPSGCQQGECIAPNKCSCSHGFEMDASGTTCIAHCTHPCLNGDCTGPNECTCRRGYIKDTKDPNGARCVGNCPNGCPNGICSGPNLCLCLPGYAKDRSVKGSQACVKRVRRSPLPLPHMLKMLID